LKLPRAINQKFEKAYQGILRIGAPETIAHFLNLAIMALLSALSLLKSIGIFQTSLYYRNTKEKALALVLPGTQ